MWSAILCVITSNVQYGGFCNCVKTVIGTRATTSATTKLQILEHQTMMFEAFWKRSNETSSKVSFTPDAIANSIDEFVYNPEEKDIVQVQTV